MVKNIFIGILLVSTIILGCMQISADTQVLSMEYEISRLEREKSNLQNDVEKYQKDINTYKEVYEELKNTVDKMNETPEATNIVKINTATVKKCEYFNIWESYDLTISGTLDSPKDINRISFRVIAYNNKNEAVNLATDSTYYYYKTYDEVFLDKPLKKGNFRYIWQKELYNPNISYVIIDEIEIKYEDYKIDKFIRDSQSNYVLSTEIVSLTSSDVDKILNTSLSKNTSSNLTLSSFSNSSTKQSVTVYVTDFGECYHKSTCSYLWNSKNAISKANAISKGYRACSRCNP